MIPAGFTQSCPEEMSPIAFWVAHLRMGERVVVFFFLYTAALSVLFGLPLWQQLLSVAVPALVFGLACAETCLGDRRTSIARDWMVPVAVLAGYWQMGWFAGRHEAAWQDLWVSWDRRFLDDWGFRLLVERRVPLLSTLLEFCYLLLYTIPGACLALLYWKRSRLTVDRFLMTFALGTLAAYALLPLIAVESPRIAFAGQDLPDTPSLWRMANLFILDHLDIHTSVFPSGHVAVAFSSAFGLRRALPGSGRWFLLFLSLAVMVFLATIYGRYHYGADGLASLAISLLAWGVCEVHDRFS